MSDPTWNSSSTTTNQIKLRFTVKFYLNNNNDNSNVMEIRICPTMELLADIGVDICNLRALLFPAFAMPGKWGWGRPFDPAHLIRSRSAPGSRPSRPQPGARPTDENLKKEEQI